MHNHHMFHEVVGSHEGRSRENKHSRSISEDELAEGQLQDSSG